MINFYMLSKKHGDFTDSRVRVSIIYILHRFYIFIILHICDAFEISIKIKMRSHLSVTSFITRHEQTWPHAHCLHCRSRLNISLVTFVLKDINNERKVMQKMMEFIITNNCGVQHSMLTLENILWSDEPPLQFFRRLSHSCAETTFVGYKRKEEKSNDEKIEGTYVRRV